MTGNVETVTIKSATAEKGEKNIGEERKLEKKSGEKKAAKINLFPEAEHFNVLPFTASEKGSCLTLLGFQAVYYLLTPQFCSLPVHKPRFSVSAPLTALLTPQCPQKLQRTTGKCNTAFSFRRHDLYFTVLP